MNIFSQEWHSRSTVDLDDPQLKIRTLDYVPLMLGAPVVKVELDEQQLDFCYNTVVNCVKCSGNAINSILLTERFVQKGTLAIAKQDIWGVFAVNM